MITDKNEHEKSHLIGYGTYVLSWLALLSLAILTVAAAGLDLGNFTLFTALLIAAIKSTLVIMIFMHIKYDEPIFKVFLAIALLVLVIVFVLMGFDVFYR